MAVQVLEDNLAGGGGDDVEVELLMRELARVIGVKMFCGCSIGDVERMVGLMCVHVCVRRGVLGMIVLYAAILK